MRQLEDIGVRLSKARLSFNPPPFVRHPFIMSGCQAELGQATLPNLELIFVVIHFWC